MSKAVFKIYFPSFPPKHKISVQKYLFNITWSTHISQKVCVPWVSQHCTSTQKGFCNWCLRQNTLKSKVQNDFRCLLTKSLQHVNKIQSQQISVLLYSYFFFLNVLIPWSPLRWCTISSDWVFTGPHLPVVTKSRTKSIFVRPVIERFPNLWGSFSINDKILRIK